MNKVAVSLSYLLRSLVGLNIVLFLTAAYRADDSLFDRMYFWLVASSLAAVLIALVGLLSQRSWKSKIIDLLFAVPAVGILIFISISSVPGL